MFVLLALVEGRQFLNHRKGSPILIVCHRGYRQPLLKGWSRQGRVQVEGPLQGRVRDPVVVRVLELGLAVGIRKVNFVVRIGTNLWHSLEH